MFRKHNHLEFGNKLDEKGEGDSHFSSSADWKDDGTSASQRKGVRGAHVWKAEEVHREEKSFSTARYNTNVLFSHMVAILL